MVKPLFFLSRSVCTYKERQSSEKEVLCFRAFAVKVEGKRVPVFPFSGFDLYHHFRNDAYYGLYNLLKVQGTGLVPVRRVRL